MAGIKLDDYQVDAVKRMKNGCILCGIVGSGKSRTALTYYYLLNGGELGGDDYVPMEDPPQDLYIITTARKRDSLEWEEEMIPFLLSATNKENNLYSNKIVVDSWNNIGKYKDVKNSFFIFDEQRVVGSGAWVKSFLKIAKTNNWILLSGTPGDTWSDYIPVFIANGFYKNRTEFKEKHMVFSWYGSYPKLERYLNTGKLIKLRNQILVNMNYHKQTKSNHVTIPVTYDVSKYFTIVKERWNIWNDKPIVNAGEFCYCLRKVVNSDPSRGKHILDLLKIHPKIIIFYNFDYELEILKNLKYGKNVRRAEWNGHSHEPVPDGKSWVYFVQYSAGSEAWNCTATDTMVFYSDNYSYKMMVQAAGRIDRRNTPYSELNYYHFKSKSTIDTAITRALKQKKKFNESSFYGRN